MSAILTEFRDGTEWMRIVHPRWTSAWMVATPSNRAWVDAVFSIYLDAATPATDPATARAELSRLRTQMISVESERSRLLSRIAEIENRALLSG